MSHSVPTRLSAYLLNRTFGGFTVGGGYWWNNGGLSEDGDYEAYTGGLAWANGPLRLAASYMNYQIESGNVLGTYGLVTNVGEDLAMDRYVVGASYISAPGLPLRSTIHDLAWDEAGPVGARVDSTSCLMGKRCS